MEAEDAGGGVSLVDPSLSETGIADVVFAVIFTEVLYPVLVVCSVDVWLVVVGPCCGGCDGPPVDDHLSMVDDSGKPGLVVESVDGE